MKIIEIIGDICLAEKCLLNALLDLRQQKTVQVLRHELLTNLKPINRSEGPDAVLFDALYKATQNCFAESHRGLF